MNVSSFYKDVTLLSHIDTKTYLQDRNRLVLDFLTGSIEWDFLKQENTVILYSLAVVVECIYHLRNLNLILPHCFLTNLVQSFVAGSKTVSAINGKTSPSASYTTYKNWILEKGSEAVTCQSKNDIITFFDNVGKYVVKGYRVSSEKLPSADIITATLHFNSQESTLQNDAKHMDWKRNAKADVERIQKRMSENINSAYQYFRKLRLHFIEKGLRKVSMEAQDVENKIIAKQKSSPRGTNEQCLKPFDSLKRKCNSCGSAIQKIPIVNIRATSDKQLLDRSFNFDATEHRNKKSKKKKKKYKHG